MSAAIGDGTVATATCGGGDLSREVVAAYRSAPWWRGLWARLWARSSPAAAVERLERENVVLRAELGAAREAAERKGLIHAQIGELLDTNQALWAQRKRKRGVEESVEDGEGEVARDVVHDVDEDAGEHVSDEVEIVDEESESNGEVEENVEDREGEVGRDVVQDIDEDAGDHVCDEVIIIDEETEGASEEEGNEAGFADSDDGDHTVVVVIAESESDESASGNGCGWEEEDDDHLSAPTENVRPSSRSPLRRRALWAGEEGGEPGEAGGEEGGRVRDEAGVEESGAGRFGVEDGDGVGTESDDEVLEVLPLRSSPPRRRTPMRASKAKSIKYREIKLEGEGDDDDDWDESVEGRHIPIHPLWTGKFDREREELRWRHDRL